MAKKEIENLDMLPEILMNDVDGEEDVVWIFDCFEDEEIQYLDKLLSIKSEDLADSLLKSPEFRKSLISKIKVVAKSYKEMRSEE